MANSVTSGDRHSFATIDTAPGASGYWTASVSMSNKNARALFFSRKGGGVGTVTLQFKTAETGAVWQDFTANLSLLNGVRYMIDDSASGVSWRAGVKNGNYSSGDIIVGLDW